MKLAHIVTVDEPFSITAKSIKTKLAWLLVEDLVSKGHQVTVFASGDSMTSAQLHAIIPKSISHLKSSTPQYQWDAQQINLYHVSESYKFHHQFDIVHDYTGNKGAIYAQSATKPVVMTLYDELSHTDCALFQKLEKAFLVSVNNKQQKQAPSLNFVGNIQLEDVRQNINAMVNDYELIYRETVWHHNWQQRSLKMSTALSHALASIG